MSHRISPVFVLLALAALACSAPPGNQGSPPDGGNLPDVLPQVSQVDHVGAELYGQPKTVLAGESTVVVGTQAAPLDPRWFGLPEADPTSGAWLRGGLAVVDTTTGHVRVYQWQDGLPRFHYQDDYDDWGDSTAPFLSLAWIDRDHSFAATSWNRLVKATKGTDGAWTFIHIALRAAGESQDAQLASVVSAAGRLYVGSDQGLAVVDPATLAVQSWLNTGAPGGATAVYGIATSPAKGAGDAEYLGILLGPADTAQATTAAVVKAGESAVQLLPFPAGTRPISIAGLPGTLAIGAIKSDGRGSLYTYVRSSDSSPVFAEVVKPDDLGASTWGDIVPRKLAYDATHSKLLVGGSLGAGRGLQGAGMVALEVGPDGSLAGPAEDVIPQHDPLRYLMPWMVDVLEVDSQGRWYVGGRQLCSEHKLKQSGLWRLEPGDKGLRVARPWTSGVREVIADPTASDVTWVGLRDTNPGMQCENAWVSQGVCRLKADGSCELDPPVTNVGDAAISGAPGVTSIAFGDPAKHVIAMATRRDATYLRVDDAVRSPQTQIDPGVGLPMTRVAWSPEGDLWLASEMHWDPIPAGDGIDPIKVNDRGPHGLGLMPLSGNAPSKQARRYVRVPSDQAPDRDIGGLPSNTVWDVLPLDGTRRALAACGIEREDPTWDHNLGEEAPNGVKGGLALIEDKQVSVIPAPAGTTFGEVVALAKLDTKTALALDAAAGVFTVDLTAKKATKRFAAPWQAPERGLSMVVNGAGQVAVGTTGGLYVFSPGGKSAKVAGSEALGYVWRLRFFSDKVLFAGTASGVVRVALDGATLPAALGPTGPQDPLLRVPDQCGGLSGCVCRPGIWGDCADHFSCECPADAPCACMPLDPCVERPGSRSCSCKADLPAPCRSGLSCLCDADVCMCDVDPAGCADGACACTAASDCPTDWICNATMGVCEQRQTQECDLHCTCETESKCSPGMHCQGGIIGFSCVPD